MRLRHTHSARFESFLSGTRRRMSEYGLLRSSRKNPNRTRVSESSARHNMSQSGFTLVELMVATAVFSVLLLVVTFGLLQISRVYYKGITESNTQATARRVTDIISQSVQFSGTNVTTTTDNPNPGTSYQFCLGNEQISYTTGYQLVDNPDSDQFQTPNALVQRTLAGCTSSTEPQNVRAPSVDGRELLSPNMRLSQLNIDSIGPGLYRIDVRIVYGDDDLLVNPTGPDARCVSETAGTQFCAVSELSTIVEKRVQ